MHQSWLGQCLGQARLPPFPPTAHTLILLVAHATVVHTTKPYGNWLAWQLQVIGFKQITPRKLVS